MSKRNYQNDYPSVTTILGVLRKPGLEYWYKKNTIQFCNEQSSKGKIVGNQIHNAIQSYIEKGKASINTEYNVEVMNALESFMAFRRNWPLKLKNAELAVTSETHRFNGTIDCIGENILLDWKTCEVEQDKEHQIWFEWKLQTSAYCFLYNELFPNNFINKAMIVSIAKNRISYKTYKMEMNEISYHFHDGFIPCLKIYNHQKRKDFTNGNGYESRESAITEEITT